MSEKKQNIPNWLTMYQQVAPKMSSSMKGEDIILSNENTTCGSKGNGNQSHICLTEQPIPNQVGKYYSEFTVFSLENDLEYMAIGVAEKGVNLNECLGSDQYGWSWDYDYSGVYLFAKHDDQIDVYPPKEQQRLWKNGDRVGVALDRNEGTLSFYLNDECMGVAFQDNRFLQQTPELYLACSIGCWHQTVTIRDGSLIIETVGINQTKLSNSNQSGSP